jgi:glutamine amidotransferase
MITIIDYKMGNIGSLQNMIKKAGGESIFTSNIDKIQSAEKIILPGVGAFDTGMKNLADNNLIEILNKKVITNKTPLLGICLGMQLLTKCSDEGKLSGLGYIDAKTIKFDFGKNENKLRIPHMGCNS